jgi:hypothetical protein
MALKLRTKNLWEASYKVMYGELLVVLLVVVL